MFLIFAVVLPFIWLPKDYIFISEEDNFANYQNTIYRSIYAWTPSLNAGNPVSPVDHSSIIPNGIFFYILSSFNIPNHLIQKIYLFLIIFITFFSISIFLRVFTKNKLIIFSCAIFYYFSFYTKSTIFYSAKMSQLILIPLFFVFFYKYLETKKIKYSIYNFFSLFFFQIIITNLANLIPTLGIYFLVIPFFILKNRITFSFFLKEYLLKILLFFLPLLPIFLYQFFIYYFAYIFDNSIETIRSSHTFSAYNSPLNLIYQLRGAWWETVSFEGTSYNPWYWFYNHPLMILSSFLLLIITIIPFYKIKNKALYIFWLVVFLFSILFASGISFIPNLYQWMSQYLPFFYIFREPWAKFTPLIIFSFSVLLAVSLESFKKRYLICLILIIIIIRSFPFFSQNFIDYNTKRFSIPVVKLPQFWFDYEKWSLKNRNSTVLSLPINYFRRNWYKEDVGNANHPLARLFGYTNVIYDMPNNNFGLLLNYFIERKNTNFIKIANIDYGLLQNDIKYDDINYLADQKKYDNSLRGYFFSTQSASFGNRLFIYKIKPEFKVDKIYLANDIYKIKDLDNLINFVSQPTFNRGSTLFMKSQNTNKKNEFITNYIDQYQKSGERGEIGYQMINPTRYKINLKNISKSVFLVFAVNYHPGWKIYTDDGKSISDEYHFMANGYANSWFINRNGVCKKTNCSLTIEYWPQRLFYIGLIIGCVTLISCLSYLAWFWIWRSKI